MQNKSICKAWFYAITNCILLLLAFTNSKHIIILPCLYTVILIIFLYIEKGLQIVKCDLIIISLLIFELFLESFSTGVNNRIPFVINQYLFTIYYFILRISLLNKKTKQFFLAILSVFFGCISLICFVSFGIFKENILEAGFENLYDFKHLYRPFGELNNVWSTIFLIFLGIGVLNILNIKKNKIKIWWILPILPICYCLIISFSRGTYLALAILIIAFIFWILHSEFNYKKKIFIIGIFIFGIFTLTLPNRQEVIRTIRFTKTTSQQRSLNNRLNSISLLKCTIYKHNLLGVGTNNYSLAVNQDIYENDNNSFTNFAPNILLQLFIEKGIIGTFLWVILILFLFWLFFTANKKEGNETISKFSLLFVIVFIMRELSFPAFFSTLSIQIIILVIIVNYINEKIQYQQTCSPKKLLIHYILLLTTFSIIIYFYALSQRDLQSYNLCLSSIQEKRYNYAENQLGKARKITPTYIYYGCLNWLRFKESGNRYYALKADTFFLKASQTNPNDIRLLRNRAIILYALNKKNDAKKILSNLIDKFPNNTLYHIDLGNILFNEKEREAASLHYAKAIKLTPSLMESHEWNQLLISDSVLVSKIITQLKDIISDNPKDPILSAKYGKLYWLLGDIYLAKKHLIYAIKHLPNLQLPWYYLKEIALKENDMTKYNTYKRRTELWSDLQHLELQEKKISFEEKTTMTVWNSYWFSNYNIKFVIWYGIPYNSKFIDITR